MGSTLTGTALQDACAVFGSSFAATPAKPAVKKSKTASRDEVEFGDDMDFLAALDLVADALTNQAELIKAEIKTRAATIMAETMVKTGKKPAAFIGTGPRSSSYVGFSRKGSNRELDAEVVAKLEKLGVSMGENVTVEEHLYINPDVLRNQTQLAAIAEAIKTAPGLEGVPVILKQDAKSITTTAETTVDELAKQNLPVAEMRSLMLGVGGITVGKFQLDGLTDSKKLLKTALEIISASKLVAGIEMPAEQKAS